MGEDMLVLVMKMARVEPARNKFGIDDCAILKCVSKSVKEQANDILSNKDCVEKVLRRCGETQWCFLGIVMTLLQNSWVLTH